MAARLTCAPRPAVGQWPRRQSRNEHRKESDVSHAPARTIEKRKLAELKPHPRQAANFRAPLKHEVEELADDLRRNGQLCPVECLPDGTLVAGHKRAEAAGLL